MREMYEITNDTESENRNKLQHVTQRVNATLRRQKFYSVGHRLPKAEFVSHKKQK
jgi:hypothetical protein